MKQLKLGSLLALAKQLEKEGMNKKDILELPIYIGNDDELNGIHCGWYAQIIDPRNPEDEDFVEMINEDHSNLECTGKAILIS